MVAMFGQMLRRDRERSGLSIARASWLVGVTPREYKELEAGTRAPSFETYDRIGKLLGWRETFIERLEASKPSASSRVHGNWKM